MAAPASTARLSVGAAAAVPQKILTAGPKSAAVPLDGAEQCDVEEISCQQEDEVMESRLTELLPEPGYFLAGAVSGGVSRTATAPLDRLKVYLLVNTKTPADAALSAAKHGHPLAALRNAGGPILDAVVTLWKTGGFRTFFAGKQLVRPTRTNADMRQGMASTLSKSCPSPR